MTGTFKWQKVGFEANFLQAVFADTMKGWCLFIFMKLPSESHAVFAQCRVYVYLFLESYPPNFTLYLQIHVQYRVNVYLFSGSYPRSFMLYLQIQYRVLVYLFSGSYPQNFMLTSWQRIPRLRTDWRRWKTESSPAV